MIVVDCGCCRMFGFEGGGCASFASPLLDRFCLFCFVDRQATSHFRRFCLGVTEQDFQLSKSGECCMDHLFRATTREQCSHKPVATTDVTSSDSFLSMHMHDRERGTGGGMDRIQAPVGRIPTSLCLTTSSPALSPVRAIFARLCCCCCPCLSCAVLRPSCVQNQVDNIGIRRGSGLAPHVHGQGWSKRH